MSIDKVDVTNAQGNLLTLTLEDISSGYIVEEIGGLDPVKASIVTSDFALIDGQQYQASSREARNITMQLGFVPNPSENQTVRALRSRLYQFFMPKSSITLKLYMTDGLVVTASGRVESCEQSLFVQDPQMNISIICFDPDFVDPTLVQLHSTFTTIDTASHSIQYTGTVDTGLTSLRFTAPKALSEFTIYHTAPDGTVRTMQVTAPLLLNDVVELCTIRGQRSISLTRGGVTSSILWAVAAGEWVILQPGLNQLYINASTTGPSAPVFVDYNNRYGGL